jgi:hypothetical protein
MFEVVVQWDCDFEDKDKNGVLFILRGTTQAVREALASLRGCERPVGTQLGPHNQHLTSFKNRRTADALELSRPGPDGVIAIDLDHGLLVRNRSSPFSACS